MSRLPRLAACLAAAASIAAASVATAAVFVPSKATDGADGTCDADCSLREAVQAANASPGADVILLRDDTYVLSLSGADDNAASGDLDVLDELVVIGQSAQYTIVDGPPADRLFQVAAGTSLELRDLTLRGGSPSGNGGAVLNAGSLTLVRTSFTGNHSTTGHGGAVYSQTTGAQLTVDDSSFVGNHAASRGGAFAIGATAELTNVTVSGNDTGPGGLGGGLYLFANADITLRNVTVAGNVASQGGGLLIESSAFTGFPPQVFNSLIAGNTGTSPDCFGSMSSSHSLIGNGTGCNLPSGSGNQVGTSSAPVDPKLDALQISGGSTPTRPLLAGSPAIGGGDPAPPGSGNGACPQRDQRGAQRPAGFTCDVGAFERTTACVAGGPTLCLAGERFAVSATFTQPGGIPTQAQARTLTEDSGYLWFFSPDNVELTVKVLDGCGVNGHYWVFAAGLTNVEVQLRVTDTATDTAKVYSNPQGRLFVPIADTRAIPTCL